MELAWYVSAGVSAVAFTVMALLIKHTLSTVPSEKLLLYIFLVGTGTLLTKSLLTGQSLTVEPVDLIVIVLIGVCSVLGNLFTFASYRVSPNPGYSAAVSSVNVALIAIFSALLLGAKLTGRGLLGVLLILGGIILLLTM